MLYALRAHLGRHQDSSVERISPLSHRLRRYILRLRNRTALADERECGNDTLRMDRPQVGFASQRVS